MERMTYTVTEVAAILGIGKNAAYTLVHREDFPKIRIGKTIRVPQQAFHAWLNSKVS